MALPEPPPKSVLRVLHAERYPDAPYIVCGHSDEAMQAHAQKAAEAEREACVMAAWGAIMQTSDSHLISRDILVHNTSAAIRARKEST